MSRIDDALRDIRSLDVIAAQASPLDALDPRARILATLAFIVTVVSFDRYAVLALLPFALFPVALAALGNVPLPLIARKLLIASPFALMIGIFNPLFDRSPMLELFGIGIAGGWLSFASIMLRFMLTVAAVLVLVGSTGFHQVCGGLRQLGVPAAFTTQLLFLHRYAQLIGGEAARMSTAHELRSGGQGRPQLAVYAQLLGHLLLRALERAQRIHLAMVSRGYDGELRSRRAARWRPADTLFVGTCSAAFLFARQVDLPRALGNWFTGAATGLGA